MTIRDDFLKMPDSEKFKYLIDGHFRLGEHLNQLARDIQLLHERLKAVEQSRA
jgi:hypothetical protein